MTWIDIQFIPAVTTLSLTLEEIDILIESISEEVVVTLCAWAHEFEGTMPCSCSIGMSGKNIACLHNSDFDPWWVTAWRRGNGKPSTEGRFRHVASRLIDTNSESEEYGVFCDFYKAVKLSIDASIIQFLQFMRWSSLGRPCCMNELKLWTTKWLLERYKNILSSPEYKEIVACIREITTASNQWTPSSDKNVLQLRKSRMDMYTKNMQRILAQAFEKRRRELLEILHTERKRIA